MKKTIISWAIVDEFGHIVGDNDGPFKQSIIFKSEQRAKDFAKMFHSYSAVRCQITCFLPKSRATLPTKQVKK